MTSRERELEAKLRLRTDERDVARAGRAAALRSNARWDDVQDDMCYCEHVNAKHSTDPIAERWIAPVLAQWIDHNGRGWTWSGHAGRFTGWLPLPPLT